MGSGSGLVRWGQRLLTQQNREEVRAFSQAFSRRRHTHMTRSRRARFTNTYMPIALGAPTPQTLPPSRTTLLHPANTWAPAPKPKGGKALHKAVLNKLWKQVRASKCADSSLMDSTLKVQPYAEHTANASRRPSNVTTPILPSLLASQSANKAGVALESLLLESADAGYMSCVEAFITFGADIRATDSFGLTPLVSIARSRCARREWRLSVLKYPPATIHQRSPTAHKSGVATHHSSRSTQ